MVPTPCLTTAPVPPPSYQSALAKRGPALHIDALSLVQRLHLLALCRLAVQRSQQQCPPPLPKGPGGAPRIYAQESMLLLALLRTLWRLGYQEMHDWLVAWPALALACGLPCGPDGQVRVPSPSQMCQRAAQGLAPRRPRRAGRPRPGPSPLSLPARLPPAHLALSGLGLAPLLPPGPRQWP